MPASDWTIIVVEDTFDDRQVLSTILEFFGIQVYALENGEACSPLAEKVRPTFVITDLAMPGIDGWEVLASIRNNPATAGIPVVAVSSYHSTQLAEEAIKGGFDGYFPKPLNPDSLIEDLGALIQT